MNRAPVNPALLVWSRERAGLAKEDLIRKFPKFSEWESGARQPTFKQADDFASRVHVPVGYLFLSEPPTESMPIPDYRTIAGTNVAKPSPDLLDVIRDCQDRQSWYRNFARTEGHDVLSFVASVTRTEPPEQTASEMRDLLGFDVEARRSSATWEASLWVFRNAVDDIGVLVMVSEIVGSNTHCLLNPNEFRGFALSDPLAPLVFLNGAATKAAQMFTLAHELAHLWLGSSALSDCEAAPPTGLRDEEVWCNVVAAEFLVPLAALRSELRAKESLRDALQRLSRAFKVSSLVILRRLLDVGWLSPSRFELAWRAETEFLRSLAQSGSRGGDFHRTTLSRVGYRFSKVLVVSTLEGQTLYRDAYRMLRLRRGSQFKELARQVDVVS